MLTLASLFDGIAGFPLAGSRHGITPVWASEIEKFPAAVSAFHFPDMVQHGDVTKIDGAKVEPVDIITFGSPCQDLSVAGKRAGMKHDDIEDGDDESEGTRSGLFMEAVRIIKEMRNATRGRTDQPIQPRYAVWENVPGAFSSNQGKDFHTVLSELAGCADGKVSVPRCPNDEWEPNGCILGDHFSIAWRTLDAQYFGVPQRRRRIYLVCDFGGQTAPKILFKQDRSSGDPAESGETGKGITKDVERGFNESGNGYWMPGVGTLRTNGSRPTNVVTIDCRNHNTSEISGTLQAKSTGGQSLNYINPVMVENHPADSRVQLDESGTCQTLTTRMGTGGGNVPMLMSHSLETYHCESHEELASVLKARDWKDPQCVSSNGMRVRRLTPLECERLQGYADGWTNIPGASDSGRYKALGNSLAIPCAEFVMAGIAEAANQ